MATPNSSSRSSAFTQSLGPNFHGVGGMSGDTPENVARAKANATKPNTSEGWGLGRITRDIGSGFTKVADAIDNHTGVGAQMNYAANSAASGFVSNYVGQQAAASGVNAAPLVKSAQKSVMQGELAQKNSFIDPKTGNLQKKAIVAQGAIDAVGFAAGEGLGMAAGKYIVKPVVNKVVGAVKNSFESPIVVNAAEKTPGVSTQFEGYFAPTKISNNTGEELISKETLGKYLSKTKASKTRVTPVRKLGSDFRVKPSLNGPTTIKRKLGDAEGYPRGYNPEQMKQVRDAEAQKRLSIGSNSVREEGRNHAAHESALVRENIARSKFDPTTLRHTNGENTVMPLDVRIGFRRVDQRESVPAFYSPEERFIGINPEYSTNNVLLHEIGHDVQKRDPKILDLLESAKKAGARESTEFSQKQTEEMLSHGVREGDAERFGDENWVPDPRGGTGHTTSSYKASNFISEHTGDKRTRLFGKGYRAAKGPEITSEHPRIKEEIKKATDELRAGRPTSTTEGNYGMKWTGKDFLNAAGIPIPESILPPSRFATLRDSITKHIGNKGTGN